MPTATHHTTNRSPDKPLNRMDRLADMLHFPAAVNAGATANILLTITVTWWFVGYLSEHPPTTYATLTFAAPLVWTALVLALNLAPVVALRALDRGTRPMPTLAGMNFVRDQHRFSDWVYLAASANMSFWILTSWAVFAIHRTPAALVTMLGLAFLVTFSPVLLRPIVRSV